MDFAIRKSSGAPKDKSYFIRSASVVSHQDLSGSRPIEFVAKSSSATRVVERPTGVSRAYIYSRASIKTPESISRKMTRLRRPWSPRRSVDKYSSTNEGPVMMSSAAVKSAKNGPQQQKNLLRTVSEHEADVALVTARLPVQHSEVPPLQLRQLPRPDMIEHELLHRPLHAPDDASPLDGTEQPDEDRKRLGRKDPIATHGRVDRIHNGRGDTDRAADEAAREHRIAIGDELEGVHSALRHHPRAKRNGLVQLHAGPFDRFPCADRDSLHRKGDMKKVLMPGGDGRIVGDMVGVLHRKHDRMVAAVALDHSMV